MAMWRARKPIAGNTPFDLDGGELNQRYGVGGIIGTTPWPYPPVIGCVSGFMTMQDATVYNAMFARKPFGPGATSLPVNLQWQITVPGLGKMS